MNDGSDMQRDFFAAGDDRVDELSGLELNRDVQRPSPGEIRVGNVLGGVDDRHRVQDTRLKPFRWVCQILAESDRIRDGRRATGSGFVIGERTILTAAHNLFVLGHRADRFEISLAANGERSSSPLGQYVCTQAIHHPKYHSSQSCFDLAVIHFDRPLPDGLLPARIQYGALSIVEVEPSVISRISGRVTGYPKHYPDHDVATLPRPENGVQAFQYYCQSDLRYNFEKRVISYDLDTGGGQSGSPLITVHQGADGELQSVAIGIHVEGGNDITGNFAVPLESEQMSFIQSELNRVRPRVV